MPTLDDQRRAAGLNAIDKIVPPEKTPEPQKERGHGRGTTDDRRVQDKGLRGVPLAGAGPGVIDGTRPGDTVRALEESIADIIIANAALAKAKAERLRQVRAELKRKT